MVGVYSVIFIWGSELFPSNIRGTASGIAITSGKLIALSGEPLINFSVNVLGVNAMVGASLTAILALPAIFFLPETLNKKIE